MEYRYLEVRPQVPVVSFRAGTFGSSRFSALKTAGCKEARRLVDICPSRRQPFDTADVYSAGASEEVLGRAIRGRRPDVLISTKMSLPTGGRPADAGSSRSRLIRARRRIAAPWHRLYRPLQLPPSMPARVEEVLSTLDGLRRRQGPLCRRVEFCRLGIDEILAAANAAAIGHVAHEVYYSLVGRDYEWELCRSAPTGRRSAGLRARSAGSG